MDNAIIIDKRMETIIKQRQVVVGTFDKPVSHGVGSQIDAVAFVGTGLFKNNFYRNIRKGCYALQMR